MLSSAEVAGLSAAVLLSTLASGSQMGGVGLGKIVNGGVVFHTTNGEPGNCSPLPQMCARLRILLHSLKAGDQAIFSSSTSYRFKRPQQNSIAANSFSSQPHPCSSAMAGSAGSDLTAVPAALRSANVRPLVARGTEVEKYALQAQNVDQHRVSYYWYFRAMEKAVASGHTGEPEVRPWRMSGNCPCSPPAAFRLAHTASHVLLTGTSVLAGTYAKAGRHETRVGHRCSVGRA